MPLKLGSRARLALVLGVVVLLFAADSLRPPERQVSARVLLAGIDVYQATLSPRMPEAGVDCRFHPTCSRYAEGAIRKHGGVLGALRAAGRVARCGPWTPAGTHDPP
ncbi:MAG TPA: membrane protein insertion efficiency factor YidD [Thermoanaerobaculia bacterium]|nr:membrane protein insertion efficiency factor YidD [Thermoanaerobaculia bacterium]